MRNDLAASGGPASALWDTLENLLAPGRRARLSPFVENAQCAVLLGETPAHHQRVESIRLLVERHGGTIERIAGHWARFADGGKDFASNDYAAPDFLDAYLAYYFSVNVPKIQLVLLDLARDGLLRGDIALLDVGVGTGTTAIAALDFLLAWGHACDLHGEPFPVTGLRLTGVDRSAGSLDHARRVVEAYARALRERLDGRGVGAPASSRVPDILRRVHDWAAAASWYCHDLEDAIPALEERPNLIIAANVWNELRGPGRAHFDGLLAGLPGGGLAIVVEPGDQRKAGALMAWRRTFLADHDGLVALAPCGQEFGGILPPNCDGCWNMRREAFLQPPLYRAFREACAGSHPAFDQFENRLLSWSYAVIGHRTGSASPAPPPLMPLIPDTLVEQSLDLRYIGSYHARDGEVTPVDYGPDGLPSMAASGVETWTESLKVCPAGQAATRIVLRRRPGFQIPPLRYGERIRLANVRVRPRDDGYILDPHPGDGTTVEPTSVNGGRYFLPDRGADTKVRCAIDEIAYRLFGFPALRPFQHTILARVLAGRSILGIAATGGGKSECFILPAMLLPGVTVVVSPLKALMTDQYDQRISARYGLDHLATFINGDVSFAERQARLRRLELGYYKLVYFTPEQLERGYVLESLRRADERVGVRYLALDEAHCISQWGHDFRPSYLNIVHRFREYDLTPVRIALTATASPDVRADICEELHLDPASVHEGGDVYIDSSNRPELNLIVRVKQTTGAKVEAILDDLRDLSRYNESNELPGAAIVFMPHTGGDPDIVNQSRPDSPAGRHSAAVTRFASYLERQLGERVAIYHGGMDSDDAAAATAVTEEPPPGDLRGRRRRTEQNGFIAGERAIMVATKGFGMGIDKPNIRLIVHRTPPGNLEAYAQEAGRAGRDGEQANVILYYSPDAPQDDDDYGKARAVQSDHEIQSYFLTGRYVRRQDVRAMREFLRRLDRRVVDTYYFTNDEAIAFLELYRDESGPYVWPDFPPRQPHGREWGDHKAILDLGHYYKQKTDYVDRILQALYRLRPEVGGGSERVVFLELVQDADARILGPQVLNAQAILDSNAYFGDALRKAGISAEEFAALVHGGDVLPLARRLRLPVHETAALLRDIKSGGWEPPLIEFKRILAPLYGPAAGKIALYAWRAYAGATKRGPGYERARQTGRASPMLDDWFGWGELPQPRGWEVRWGPALDDDARFKDYLNAFMELHDARKENDWAAYRRLLTDYIGVGEDGTIPSKVNAGQCLRAVLLGYLRTSETIQGGNCRSCNRCVPDEDFDRYTAEERRAVVVRIGQRLEALLDRAEAHAAALPPAALIDDLFAAIAEEDSRGNAVIRYVEGWSARLLDQQADHRAALWVRLRAMRDGLIAAQPRAFGRAARRLVRAAGRDNARPLWGLLEGAHEDAVLSTEPLVHAARAQVALWLGLATEEAQALRRFVRFLEQRQEVEADVARRICTRLGKVTASGAPLADPEMWRACRLHLARLSDSARGAADEYAHVVAGWDWPQVQAEVAYCRDDPPASVAAQIGVLCAWGRQSGTLDQARTADAIAFLAADGWPLVERAGAREIEALVESYGLEPFKAHPAVAAAFFGRLRDQPAPDDAHLRYGLALGLAVLAAGAAPDDLAVEVVAGAILEGGMPATRVRDELRRYDDDGPRLGNILAALHATPRPMTSRQLEQWLVVLSPALHQVSPPLAAAILLGLAARGAQSDAVLDTLGPLMPALGVDDVSGDSFQLWLKLCRQRPAHLVVYIVAAGATPAATAERVDAAFGQLIGSGDRPAIEALFAELGEHYPRLTARRLRRAVEFYRALRDFVHSPTGLLAASDNRDALHRLRRAVMSPPGRAQAAMLAVAIQVLRQRLNPNWHTPVGFEAEALCEAGRLEQAAELARQYPATVVGPQRQPLGERVAQLRRSRVEVADDVHDEDCRAIMQTCFMGPILAHLEATRPSPRQTSR